jgi:hypothetical protein
MTKIHIKVILADFYFLEANLFICDIELLLGGWHHMEWIIAFVIGFIFGVIVVALAIELGMKKTDKGQPTARPTHKWSISEISNPKIIAEYMGDMKLPKNARIVVNQYDNQDVFKGINVKHHSGIRGNFILGDDRALVIAGPITENELGIWTIEKSMLQKLNQYFEDSWAKASKLTFDEKKP